MSAKSRTFKNSKSSGNKGRAKQVAKARGSASSKAELESQTRWPKTTFISFPGVNFPDQLRLRVKYNETVAFSGALSPAAQVWQPNSIFNVNATSGTGTPSFYNALGTVYKKYVVMGFEAIVEVATGMTSGSGFQWALQASDQNTGSKSTIQMREGKWSTGGTVGIIGGITISRKKFPYLTTGEVNGQKNIQSDPSMYTGIGQNPTDALLLTFRATSNDASNNAVGIVRITLIQDVILKEVIDVAV
jgi:hypothetical protein